MFGGVRVAHLFSFLCCVFVFGLSLSCVLCAQCCQCFWIVCLCLVCCVPNVVSFSGLFVSVLCVVYPMLSVSLDCLSLSCVLCTQCCQCFWIVCLCLVCCVPNVVSFSGLFVSVLCVVCPMLSVSLDSPFLIAPSDFSNVFLLREIKENG